MNLSCNLKVASSYTEKDLKAIVDKYINLYKLGAQRNLKIDNDLKAKIIDLGTPHNIEYCISNLRDASTKQEALQLISNSKDVVMHLSDAFAHLPHEDQLFLIIIGLFSENAIPDIEKRQVLIDCLERLGLFQTEGNLGVDVFNLLFEKNQEYVTQTVVNKQYYPRLGLYIMGGPPEIRLASHQLLHPSYWEALNRSIDKNILFRKIAETCVLSTLCTPTILTRTKPEVLEIVRLFGYGENEAKDRVFEDIHNNFLLDKQ